MKIKNLDKAAKRIKKAVKNKEKIIILGDSDLDGIASVIIAKEIINNLGGNIVKICFPRREQGYGMNEIFLKEIERESPALLIAYDFGISNFKEVKLADKLGFEVIIVDHHQILDNKLPEPAIIVNPKQEKDEYSFKEFAAAGLSYCLALELLKNSQSLKNSFLELAALATIADMMPIEADNKEIVFQGLDLVYNSWRPGIQALSKVFEKEYGLVKINKINSLLNIRDEKEYPIAYTLLTCSDKNEADKIAKDLLKQSIEKKRKIQEILLEVEERIENQSLPIVFEGNESWEVALLGTVASLIANKYSKPVFLYRDDTKIQGTIRAVDGYNVVQAMKQSADILNNYGGHAKAAGFNVDKKNLKKFYNNLIKYYS